MSAPDISLIPSITMEDDLGIVYLIETAQQFWSELEDILRLPTDPPTLFLLDMTLKRFIALCATYHEQYLQSPLQLQHAFELILHSDLFQFHSERMTEIVVDHLQRTTDPHLQFISYHLLLTYGQRRAEVFRSHKRWQPLLPLLMDHVLVEIDPDIEDTYFGLGTGGSAGVGVPVPIEAKLRSLGVKILYEVCRVQKLSVGDLHYLFDLVEQTRYMQDETFNYSVIKLIVALNEQFMVASLAAEASQLNSSPNATSSSERSGESKNRVIRVLMRRLGLSKTFGENMIFMLNRAKRTSEDLCMQLLILKILYVLFTTKGTEEYFYTNDLRVLVDVFLRELTDLDEDSEALKHTYLRVLHPLLTKTQLRNIPYKRSQILYALESLIGNTKMRDINHTTKRLVERCLGGEWCVQLRASSSSLCSSSSARTGICDIANGVGKLSLGGDKESDTASDVSTPTAAVFSPSSQAQLERSGSMKRGGVGSKSVENLRLREGKPKEEVGGGAPRSPLDKLRRQSNSSTHSLPTVPPSGIATPTSPMRRSTVDAASPSHHQHHHQYHAHPISPSQSTFSYTSLSPPSPISPMSVASAPTQPSVPRRRPPPQHLRRGGNLPPFQSQL
ncbi:hypothetical protein BDQ17DRAFT_801679 [Cyathus striatus]|nr:hypothetical protein BDQ17DRAFT_801679 [Cyathus striatus]